MRFFSFFFQFGFIWFRNVDLIADRVGKLVAIAVGVFILGGTVIASFKIAVLAASPDDCIDKILYHVDNNCRDYHWLVMIAHNQWFDVRSYFRKGLIFVNFFCQENEIGQKWQFVLII